MTPATASVAIGGTPVAFTAQVTNTTDNGVSWQVNGIDGGNETVGTISSSGQYISPAALPSPTLVTVTAVANGHTGLSGEAELTLTNPGPQVTVTVTPSSAIVTAGAGTQIFVATVEHATNTGVNWQVNGQQGGNTVVGTISAAGLYTPPASPPAQPTVTVSAISIADPTKSGSAQVTVVNSATAPPTISGTPSTTATAGQIYSFAPTASSPRGAALTFGIASQPKWASFSTATGVLTGTPASTDAGVYTNIVISVSDGVGFAALAPFSITVSTTAPPPPPSISGTPPTTVVAGQSYSFTPTASSPRNAPLQFAIANKPSWASFSATTGTLSGTPSSSNVGSTANVTITVSDGTATAQLAPFAVSVLPLPTISGTPPASVIPGQLYSFTPAASSPRGGALTFSISNKPSWATFSTTTGTLTGTPTSSNVGSYANITISVGDGVGTASLAPFTLSVVAPPVIGGTPATSVEVGQSYSFTPTASSPRGAALTFSIVNIPVWATFSSATGKLSGTPGASNAGSYAGIVITVNDGTQSASLPAFTVTVTPSTAPPTISGTPSTTIAVGKTYSFTPTASSPRAGATLTFSIANLPSWASFSTTTGTLSGAPAAANVGSFGAIVITVNDGTQSASLPAFTIVVTPSTAPPTISGTPSTTIAVGKSYSFTPTASSPRAGATLTFSIANLPSWASFSTTTGTLSGAPAAANVGSFGAILITVNDGTQSASLPAFNIVVTPSTAPPTISGTPPTTVTAGAAYSFTPTASSPRAGATLTFSVANLPSWATFSGTTGTVSGTPAAANVGSFAGIVISVNDGTQSASLPAFTVTVTPSTAPPTIGGTPPTTVSVGNTYSFTPTASSPRTGATLTFSITNLPSWAAFSTATGKLSGAPAAANVGAFAGIVISVNDGTQSASLPAFAITVTPSTAPPTIGGTPSTSVTAGTAYSFTPTASSPRTGATLTFSIFGQPSWAAFNTATGQLSGTPTAANVGTYANVTISVSDGTSSASLAPFTITVKAATMTSATLTWTAPTLRTDGTTLTNISGFKIYYGTTQGTYPTTVTVPGASTTTYTVTGLTSGVTYYFVTTAYDSSGMESSYTNPVALAAQ